MRVIVLVLCLVCGFSASLAHSKISHVHIDELVQWSDQIVIGTVTEVTESKSGSTTVRRGIVDVSRTLKGKDLHRLQFIASSDFEDSTVDAIEGEEVLLFLNGYADGNFHVAIAGRGRMPLRHIGGKTYATFWDDIVLPEGAPVIPGPEPKYSFIVSVELPYLEKLIAKYKYLKYRYLTRAA